MPIIEWLLTTRSFSIYQMFVLTKTFVPSELFDLDIILKVTAATYFFNLAHMNGGTYPTQASYQAVLGVLLFASVSLPTWTDLGHCDLQWRSPEVTTSPIGIYVNIPIS